MKEYIVKDFKHNVIDWHKVSSIQINSFPWYEEGKKQITDVKMALANEEIYLKVYCEDAHSFARITAFNGPVYKDSCFEFFLTPRDIRGSDYVNFEFNCCGTLLVGYGQDINNRNLVAREQGRMIKVRSSIQTLLKHEEATDKFWTLDIVIPLSLIEEITGEKLVKGIWYGNFYRCGGKSEPQFATWQPIKAKKPDFHRPEQFGLLRVGGMK